MRQSSCSGRAEDNIAHDPFRPGGTVGLKGGIDAQGKLSAWRHHLVTFGDDKHSTSGGGIGQNAYPAGFPPAYALYTSAQPLSLRTGPFARPATTLTAGWHSHSLMSWLVLPDAIHSSSNSRAQQQATPWSSGEQTQWVTMNQPDSQSLSRRGTKGCWS